MKDLQKNNLINSNGTGGGAGGGGGRYVAPKDTTYREVVIIGNGPSGISLSYFLSGNFPYWSPEKVARHPDEILRARLDYADAQKSLVEQDLVELADGLEGRSTNPVSLLLDNLAHPCADLGMTLPSMLYYKHRPEKQVDHIVLGKGPPGGTWHRMDPNLRTLSLAAWMSLPGYDFPSWEAKNPQPTTEAETESEQLEAPGQQNESVDASPLQRRNLRLKEKGKAASDVQSRALISRVAAYYESYVREMGLEKNFWNNVTVTNVFPIRVQGHAQSRSMKSARWMVVGTRGGKTIHIACRNVVLANGSSDMANRLGLRSEALSIPWLKHELPELEAALENVTEQERKKMKPVLIVGAGLSAADAVTICRQSGIPVIHVYRSRTAGLDKMLPENVYPEYHEVHKMMKDPSRSYKYYTPVPEHAIVDLQASPGSHRVRVRHLVTGETRDFDISYCAILIGARPDLRFLHSSSLLNNGPHGVVGHQISNSPLIERQDVIKGPQEKEIMVDCFIEEDDCCSENNILEDTRVSRLTRHISWLKIFCAKCRHINVCERARRNDYKRICGHNFLKCECPAGAGAATLKIKGGLVEKSLSPATKFEEAGLGLGEDPAKPIDGKSNPIAVDKFSNQILRTPPGLYAMGPLVGDNFVRFIPGGALAITAALHKDLAR